MDGEIKFGNQLDDKEKLLEETLAREIEDHLISIYRLFKTAHPEWPAVMMIVGDKDDEYVASRFRIISQEDFKGMFDL